MRAVPTQEIKLKNGRPACVPTWLPDERPSWHAWASSRSGALRRWRWAACYGRRGRPSGRSARPRISGKARRVFLSVSRWMRQLWLRCCIVLENGRVHVKRFCSSQCIFYRIVFWEFRARWNCLLLLILKYLQVYTFL